MFRMNKVHFFEGVLLLRLTVHPTVSKISEARLQLTQEEVTEAERS